jgi:hypothetical protein
MRAMQPPAHDAPRASSRVWPGAAIFGALGLALVVLLATRELSAIESREQGGAIDFLGVVWTFATTDAALGLLAGAGALGLAGFAVLRARGLLEGAPLRRLADAALIMLVLAAGLTWGYASRGLGQSYYIKSHDAFHYVLGPKYFAEVGYFRFYDCIAEADFQTMRLLEGKKVRDLQGYDTIRSKAARKRAKCETLFSPERWQQFKGDYELFGALHRDRIPDVVRDHGYNGTPFNAFMGGLLSNSFELTYSNLVWWSLLDTLGILLAFFALSWAVGWRWACLVALVFFTAFTDRGYFILGSFFRYHWLIFSALGMAALARGKHLYAGALLATAGMLNVFPVLFFAGIGLKMLWSLALERTLHKPHLRFVQGALAASVVLGALSISHAEGPANYARFFEKMSHHAELVTRSRVGLRYDLSYQGETSNDEYSAELAAAIQKSQRPYYYALLVVLIAALVVIARQLDDLSATVLCGFALFFYLFSTVEYYYGIYALLPLALYGQRARPWALPLLALPLFGNALAAWIFGETRALGIVNNTVCSYTITVVLLAYQIALSSEPLAVAWLERARRIARGALAGSGVAIAAFTVAFLGPSTLARATGPTLVFGGDVSLGREQHGFARKRGYADAIGSLDELRDADLAVANLECVIATQGERWVEKNETASYYFRGRPEMLAVLEHAGIDAVQTANNHSLDYGVTALQEQRKIIDGIGLARFGDGDNLLEACKPAYRWVGDVAVALFSVDSTQPSFAATRDKPGICHFALADKNKAIAMLSPLFVEARKRAHLIIVAPHWGPNLETAPRKDQIRFGEALIDAGADAILGTSAHKLHGLAIYDGRPIVHGAGDLLFDFGDGYDEGGLFSLVLSKNGVKQVWFTPLVRAKGRSTVATGGAAHELLQHYRGRSAALGTRVIVVDERAGYDLGEPESRASAPPSELPPPNPTLKPSPGPVTEPPADCVASVPDFALAEPIRMGPITFLGARLLETELRKRGPIWVESYWRAEETIGQSLRVRVQGRSDTPDAGRWRAEHETCDWQWPTDRWQAGVIYKDLLGIRPPDKLGDGTFAIQIGLVDDAGIAFTPPVAVGELRVSLPR